MSAVPQFLKRLEARIALALAKVNQALAGVQASANHLALTNGAGLGPAVSLSFAAPAFVPKSGKVRVWVEASVTGTTIVAGDTVSLQLTRDSGPFGMAQVVTALTGAGPASLYSLSNVFEDTVAAGSSHIWAALVTGNPHTISLAAGNVAIVITELPG
jgi:hypothetical protein